jgi:micrococcal nuclease
MNFTIPALTTAQYLAHRYHYTAQVADVYDGDTITVHIDLGFGVWLRHQQVRLARINAPEVRGLEAARGLSTASALRTLLQGQTVHLQSIKDQKEKYGRWLAEVWLLSATREPLNVSDHLVKAGLALYRTY